MLIRPATPDDAEAVVAIYAPIVTGTPISFELRPPSADEMRGRITSTLQNLPWLAGEDAQGRLCGYVYASKLKDRPAYQWSVETTVYVREDCRGTGVGKRLYARLFDELLALGYFQAFAGITLPNPGSVALHESLGFQPIARYVNVGYKLGAWRDVGYWQRPLRPLQEPQPLRRFGAAA